MCGGLGVGYLGSGWSWVQVVRVQGVWAVVRRAGFESSSSQGLADLRGLGRRRHAGFESSLLQGLGPMGLGRSRHAGLWSEGFGSGGFMLDFLFFSS